jgi:CheY-like chemotaxis protein
MAANLHSESAPEDRSKRVLIVDDNVAGAETLAMLLSMNGYECETASTGQEALAACHQNHPGTVLLDIRLPDMSGYEVAKELMRSPDTASTRIIALSGAAPDSSGEDRDWSFTHRLTKPVSFEELDALLQNIH